MLKVYWSSWTINLGRYSRDTTVFSVTSFSSIQMSLRVLKYYHIHFQTVSNDVILINAIVIRGSWHAIPYTRASGVYVAGKANSPQL
jgi:hypothetical protein